MRPRPIEHLESVSRDYPGVWFAYDRFLAERDWPRWCHCPVAAAYAVVSGGGDNRVSYERHPDTARVAALAAWRPTQSIYRFDPTLLVALLETPLTGDIPTEHLYRLPEWCVYVELPGAPAMHGYYAHLESDTHNGRTELRLLLDTEHGLLSVALHLGGTLAKAVDGFVAEAAINAAAAGGALSVPPGFFEALSERMGPLVSVLLYLCADDAELRATRGRGRLAPAMRVGKRGPAMPPAKSLEVWEVGFKLGSLLRDAERTEHQGGTVRPHVRRAHWHSYWRGEGRTERVVRWISPILVGGAPTRATVREVE